MAEHNKLGKFGENLAEKYLRSQNYEIREKNWRSGHKEIDIIAISGSELIFVEVKTRSIYENTEIINSEIVSEHKQKLLISAANDYILDNELDMEIRFDIILVLCNHNKAKIQHIIDAFYPEV